MPKKAFQPHLKSQDIIDLHKSIATISFSHSLSHDNFVSRGLIVLNTASFITAINIAPSIKEVGSSSSNIGLAVLLFGVGAFISSIMAFMLMSIASQRVEFYTQKVMEIYTGKISVDSLHGYGFSKGAKIAYIIFFILCLTMLVTGWYKLILIFLSL